MDSDANENGATLITAVLTEGMFIVHTSHTSAVRRKCIYLISIPWGSSHCVSYEIILRQIFDIISHLRLTEVKIN